MYRLFARGKKDKMLSRKNENNINNKKIIIDR